jgi:ATP-dependent DNA helicase RecG
MAASRCTPTCSASNDTLARRLISLADKPVAVLAGIGPKKASALEQVGVTTILDLLTYYPRRYLDRTNQADIADLVEGEEAMVLAIVKRANTRRTRAGRVMVEIDVFDGSSYLKCTFFNQPWRSKQLKAGTEAVFFGKVDRYRGRRQMTNPVVDLVGDRTGRIVPVYPQSEKVELTTWEVAGWMAEALDRAGDLIDPVPVRVRDSLDLVDRTWAIHQIHAPESMGAAQAARRRLAFDELFRLQVVLVVRKRALERDALGIRHRSGGPLLERFRAQLPFTLTKAQERAIAEIAADLTGPHPMHRLLQGDVGSGKTIVALHALLTAVEGGHQGALMAPTEVLAEQHFLGIRDVLAGLTVPDATTLLGDRPVRVELLTNRTTAGERARLQTGLAEGAVDLLIGTHALLGERVQFRSLGVIVIDEQHRFGVDQRAALRAKGGADGEAVPDVLVMTATPIPRTAAMTVYGDLDSTILDELPAGRQPVSTHWARGPLEESAAWDRVRTQVAGGRQAYIVCPLIEESEKIQATSATQEFERLQSEVFPDLRLALLHGQLPAKDKEATMAAFRRAEIDVLVSTTVIEVGIDVPNATVMVIESADRFGIAQLHQLRGRVGRGAATSWCYLLGDGLTPEAETRLQALVDSQDGFHLAEVDLDLRGEGTILGVRQKGRSDLKLASLRRDRDLVAQAREAAFAVVDADPTFAEHQELALEVRDLVDDEEREYLFRS